MTTSFSDINTESNVVACLIKSDDSWIVLPDGVGEEDFTSSLLRGIYLVLEHCYNEDIKIDWVTISQKLPESLQQELKDLGDWSYLEALRSLPINPANIVHEAKKLQDLTLRRRMHKAAQTIAELAGSDGSSDYLLEKVESIIADIPYDTSSEVFPIGERGLEYIESKMANPTEVPGLPSGFPEFDKLIGGFQPGRLYITAARLKVGKSLIMLNWAKHLAVENREPLLWVSSEHSFDIEYPRLLSIVSQVPAHSVERGLFVNSLVQTAKVEDAEEQIRESPFHFTYMPEFTLGKIKRMARKYAKVHGIKALFLDYIKPEFDLDRNTTEWQALGKFTFGLKALAEKYKIALITAVQINRIGENIWREDGELSFAQVAGSDRIGHAMDYGLVLRPLNKRERDQAGFVGEEARILEIAESRHGGNYRRLLNFKADTLTLQESRNWDG